MRTLLIAALIVFLPLAASAQRRFTAPEGTGSAQNVQPEQLKNVGIDQRLNEQVPLDLEFRDEEGRFVKLGDYFGQRPVVLALVYYDCPMLCTMVLNGLVKAMNALKLTAGTDFDVVAVSFDPREGPDLAQEKKRHYIRHYGRPGSEKGWHFLTGNDDSIRALTRAAGFRYTYDPQTQQFAHASALMVLTPTGKLARYLYGIEYSARDLRLALVEASQGKIGNPVDQVLLYCFHYDPITGKYGMVVMNTLRLAGLATVFALGSFMLVMFRRERRGNER